MKKHFAVAFCLAFVAMPAWAVPIVNPSPGMAGDDGGVVLFIPDDVVVAIEILDLAALFLGFPFPDDGFGGSEFGFHYSSDPGGRITIFDSFDQDSGGDPQVALINFLIGEVLDVDGGTTQSIFTPVAGTAIGFYLTLSADFVAFFGFDFDTIFTQAWLNPGGEDMAAAFPLFENPGFLLAFGATNPFDPDGDPLLLGLHVAVGITAVPEPSSLFLMLGGLLPLLLISRRRLYYSGQNRPERT